MKRILITSLIVVSIISVSCSSSEKTDNSVTEATQDPITEVSIQETVSTPEPTPEPIEEKKEYPLEFCKGVTIVFPNSFKLVVDEISFKTKVEPSSPGMFNSYYEVKDANKVYIHVEMNLTNLKNKSHNSDEFFDLRAIYDSKYEFTSFLFVEKSDGSDFDSMFSYIKPLQTVRLHALIEVPTEVQESDKPYDIILTTDRDIKLLNNECDNKEIIMADEIELAKYTDIECNNNVELNTKIVKEDYAELTLTTFETTDDIYAQNKTSYSMGYLNTEKDQTYIHFISDLKSLHTESEDTENMFDIDVYYDNCYKYNGFSTLEYPDGSDFSISTYIDPLSTEKIHHIAKVPISIVEDEKPLIAIITLGGDKYKYTIK